jgi:glycine betaine/choline ABC-type transport system substrate-binding protein
VTRVAESGRSAFGVCAGSLALIAAMVAGCGGEPTPPAPLTVGAEAGAESELLANLYAAALRFYGTDARVEVVPDPLAGLDSGAVTVVPGFTGALLDMFAPGMSARSDDEVYEQMVGVLPEGVAAGDYTTAAEDKPAAAVSEQTATAWGDTDLDALVQHCADVVSGAVRGARTPERVGRCVLPKAREFADESALFEALAKGAVTVAWTTTADPDVPAEAVVLTDSTPALIQAENAVPLYRRNALTPRQVLAVNELAGVLDTASLKRMRADVAAGADPRRVADAWLADNPIGR